MFPLITIATSMPGASRKLASERASLSSLFTSHGTDVIAQPINKLKAMRLAITGSCGQAEVAFGAGDEGAEAGFVTAFDGDVKADALHDCGQVVGRIAHHFKICQAA